MSSSASRQSNWVDLLRRASSGDGPEVKRPPHSAIEWSCSLLCSMDIGVFLCGLGCLSGIPQAYVFYLTPVIRQIGLKCREGHGPACRHGLPVVFLSQHDGVGFVCYVRQVYSTVFSGTSMPLLNFTSRAAATLLGRP